MTDRVALPVIVGISVAVVAVVGVVLLGRPAPRGTAADGPAPLAAVNAVLNGTSVVLLVLGYTFIRRRNVVAHRACMIAAFGTSALFLVSYLAHHASWGSRPFSGHGWIRTVYFAVLLSHIVLAATIVPLALATLYRAWRGQLTQHRRLARWTLPTWLYVSVTGVLVYWMLYHLARGS